MMSKIISMSLYGDGESYGNGAIANAKLSPRIYPGWKLRIYCEKENPYKQKLIDLNCEVIEMGKSFAHGGMFWRFMAAWDTEAERVILRDADSRLNVREAEAVKDWESSGCDAHCMSDHQHHRSLPIFGGMWGIKCGVLPKELLKELKNRGESKQKRIQDMFWLRSEVLPLVENSLLRHTSVETQWDGIPFPEHPKFDGFVGQQYDKDNNPIVP